MASERAQEAIKLHKTLLDDLNVDSIMSALTSSLRMPSYSLNNLMLLVSQRPDVGFVAGMRWYNRHNRYVKKGSRALYVYAPMLVKDREKSDPEAKKLIFRLVPVFDYRDTDGEPLDFLEEDTSLPYDDLSDELATLHMDAIQHATHSLLNPTALTYEDLGEATFGVYRPKTRTIALNSTKTPRELLSTLVHELAHAVQHLVYDQDKWTSTSKPDKELVAEFTAFKVLALLGVSNESSSAHYIAGWAKHPDRKEPWQTLITDTDTITKRITSLINDYLGDQSAETTPALDRPALHAA